MWIKRAHLLSAHHELIPAGCGAGRIQSMQIGERLLISQR